MVTRFSVIVADCPWQYEDPLGGKKGMARKPGSVGVRRSAEGKYSVMRLPDIIGLAPQVQDVAADACVLALWCPNSLLFTHGHPTLEAWGFTYKQTFVWVKTTNDGTRPRPGMGRMFRNSTESALIGVRGKPKCLNHAQLNVDLHRWLGHSAKPDTLQSRLELMFPGPYLELFARRELEGWVTIGDECPGTVGVDIRDWFSSQAGAKRVA
jgi:N6-adenosine-specific RNA methylase IME4